MMTAANTQRGLAPRQVRRMLAKLFLYLLLSLGALFMLVPLFWMVSTSLKAQWQVFTQPITWIPSPVQWHNYVEIFTSLPFSFLTWIKNTLILTGATIIGTLLSSSVAAYGFAKYRAPGKNLLFIVLLSTMMLPGTVTMIPVYVMWSKFKLIDTFVPLILPAFFGGSFNIFLLRQFFSTIPNELEDAAKIDGMGTLRILSSIILPLSVPILITVAIMQFNGTWNDFLGPLLYFNRPQNFTLALGINFFKSQYNVQWNYMMGASFISLLPSLILFFTCQKYFVESITLTGVKG